MSRLQVLTPKKVCIFGSGAFGTCMSTVLARKNPETDVMVWHMNEAEAQNINREHVNMYFLPGAPLQYNIRFSSDPRLCLEGAELVLFVIPTQFMRGFLAKHRELLDELMIKPKIPVVVCSKGIELQSLKFPGDLIQSFFPTLEPIVLAGPSFAIEVARGMATNVTVASKNIEIARHVQKLISTADGSFRCWASSDPIGCEVASAMKNVLAIGSGILTGMGLANNARAALICRGLREIETLTRKLGGNCESLDGLAGVGDLLLTCSSEKSRNFTVGMRLGRGETLKDILATSKAVAEGVATAKSLALLANKMNVPLPICQEIYAILYKNKSALVSFHQLMHRPLLDESATSGVVESSSKL